MGKEGIVGQLQEDGTIEYNCDMSTWYDNPEFEECEDCIQYPLCGARACPFKRIVSTEDVRYDCRKNDEEEFLARVHAFIDSSGVFD